MLLFVLYYFTKLFFIDFCMTSRALPCGLLEFSRTASRPQTLESMQSYEALYSDISLALPERS